MKRLLTLSLLLISSIGLSAQTDRPTVAVVLSGGGAKGVAHIGALKVIEEAGFPIDIITGTSMGSLIGGLYSLGYSSSLLDSLVLAQDWMALLTDRTDPAALSLRQKEEQNTYAFIRNLSPDLPNRGGLIRGRNLMHLFRSLYPNYTDSISFDSLPIRFACVATDIITNQEVVLRNGQLIKAMRASMAIPGAFTPVRMGDRVLVDGGLKNNYPADIARAMGADIVIGVSVQAPPISADNISDAASVLNQIVNINCKNKYSDNIALTDLFINVDVEGFSSTSYSTEAIDSLIHRGTAAARAKWNDLLALRRNHHIDSTLPASRISHLPPAPKHNTSSLQITRTPIAYAAFRFDTEEMGALQLSAKLPLHSRLPIGLQATLRLGHRLMGRMELSWLTRHTGFNPTIAITYRNNDLDIYSAAQRTYNVRYRQLSADIAPLDLRLRKFDLKAGVRLDYFDYYGQLLGNTADIPSVDDDLFFSYHFSSDLNTENSWYFPSRGTRFHSSAFYRTTNLLGYNSRLGILDASAHWRVNIPLSSRLAMQPMLYGRVILGDEIPLAFTNVIGGETFAHYVEQQLPFAGIGHIEITRPLLFATQLQLQYRILSHHYLILRGAAAFHTSHINPPDSDGFFFGWQAGYSYLTFIGPIGARIGYSTLSRSPYLYINFGHTF